MSHCRVALLAHATRLFWFDCCLQLPEIQLENSGGIKLNLRRAIARRREMDLSYCHGNGQPGEWRALAPATHHRRDASPNAVCLPNILTLELINEIKEFQSSTYSTCRCLPAVFGKRRRRDQPRV